MFRIIFLVAILASVGQITNTIYVPAMSNMALSLLVSPHYVQLIMAAFLLPYGLSQFIYGPLSDHFGRRRIIILGLMIYIAGTTMTCMIPQFNFLIIGSFIQGLGIGVAGVMARTVMKDCYHGHHLQKANSIMSSVLVFAPLISPLLGGLLTSHFFWLANFIFLLIFSLLVLFLIIQYFPETNQHVKQQEMSMRQITSSYKTILTSRIFKVFAINVCLAFAGVSVFEACCGLLFREVLHFSTLMTSILFISPIPAYLLGNYLAGIFIKHLSLIRILFYAMLIMLIASFSLLILALMNIVTLKAILIPAMLFFFGVGVIFPTATTGAVDPFPRLAGTAGALLGGMQNIVAGFVTVISSLVPQQNQTPIGVILSVLTLLMLFSYIYYIILAERKTSLNNMA